MARILIVDDRPNGRETLVSALRSGGHDVIEPLDDGEALRAAEHASPQLIVSAIVMATRNGAALVRSLRAHPALGEIPVLFVAPAFLEREARDLAQQCGAIDVLTQPNLPPTILATVDAVRGGRPVVRPRTSIAGPSIGNICTW